MQDTLLRDAEEGFRSLTYNNKKLLVTDQMGDFVCVEIYDDGSCAFFQGGSENGGEEFVFTAKGMRAIAKFLRSIE